MRVASKYSLNGPYTVLDESPKYYIVWDAVGHSIALDKQEWEPVPEWVDVTSECYASLIDNTYRIYHRKGGDGKWIGDQFGYRVTNANDLSRIKVEVKR